MAKVDRKVPSSVVGKELYPVPTDYRSKVVWALVGALAGGAIMYGVVGNRKQQENPAVRTSVLTPDRPEVPLAQGVRNQVGKGLRGGFNADPPNCEALDMGQMEKKVLANKERKAGELLNALCIDHDYIRSHVTDAFRKGYDYKGVIFGEDAGGPDSLILSAGGADIITLPFWSRLNCSPPPMDEDFIGKLKDRQKELEVAQGVARSGLFPSIFDGHVEEFIDAVKGISEGVDLDSQRDPKKPKLTNDQVIQRFFENPLGRLSEKLKDLERERLEAEQESDIDIRNGRIAQIDQTRDTEICAAFAPILGGVNRVARETQGRILLEPVYLNLFQNLMSSTGQDKEGCWKYLSYMYKAMSGIAESRGEQVKELEKNCPPQKEGSLDLRGRQSPKAEEKLREWIHEKNVKLAKARLPFHLLEDGRIFGLPGYRWTRKGGVERMPNDEGVYRRSMGHREDMQAFLATLDSGAGGKGHARNAGRGPHDGRRAGGGRDRETPKIFRDPRVAA